MALDLGWSPRDAVEPRESYWAFDDAIDWQTMDEEHRAAYWRDGDAKHCIVRNGGKPTRITYRALTAEERFAVRGLATARVTRRDGESDEQWQARLSEAANGHLGILYAFRVGVRFPEHEGTSENPGPARPRREQGLFLLPPEWVERLSASQRKQGLEDLLVSFYGGLVWRASTLDEACKSEPDRGVQP